jgi:uncharacterized protein YlaI
MQFFKNLFNLICELADSKKSLKIIDEMKFRSTPFPDVLSIIGCWNCERCKEIEDGSYCKFNVQNKPVNIFLEIDKKSRFYTCNYHKQDFSKKTKQIIKE